MSLEIIPEITFWLPTKKEKKKKRERKKKEKEREKI